MNSSLKIHIGSDSLNNGFSVVYFKKSYLANQQHQQLICYENSRIFFPLALDSKFAISLPGSPFGSFFIKDSLNMDQFLSLIDEIKIDLSSKGIEALQIKQPPGCYTDFVPREFFQFAGFEEKHADINQQIELKSNWEQTIHTMQKRKLDSLKAENFEFRKMENEELETAHKFIDVCRQAQDLKINISYELLRQLTDSTDAYDIFGVFREGKISSLCIAVRVTDKVAYYYLPATSPMFRSQSPMVMLIAGMVDYYCKLNYDFLDLGISSVEGKAQESLRIFKERMGASQSEKSTWILQF